MFFLMLLLSIAFAKETSPVSVGYRVNARPVIVHNPDFDSQTNDNTWFYLQNVRLITTGKWDGVKIRASVQDSRIWGEESSSILSQDSLIALHEGYFQLNTKNNDHWVRVGRQAYSFGKGTVLSKANWNLYGLAYDGIRLHTSFNNMTWDFVASQQGKARTMESICIENCDSFVAEEERTVGDHLLVLTNKTVVSPSVVVQPYMVMLFENASETDLERSRHIYSPGLLFSGTAGSLDYFVEGLYQFGQESEEVDHRAWKAVADATWKKEQFGLGFRYEENSGDGDATDQVNNNLEPFFPPNHGHRGWADKVGSINSRDLAIRVSYQLTEQFKLKVQGHHFALSNVSGSWMQNNGSAHGVTPLNNTVSTLGEEVDLEIEWSPRKGESFRLTHAHFIPTGVGKEIGGSDRSSTTYLWIMLRK